VESTGSPCGIAVGCQPPKLPERSHCLCSTDMLRWEDSHLALCAIRSHRWGGAAGAQSLPPRAAALTVLPATVKAPLVVYSMVVDSARAGV
jgi:hypothetical protein